MSGALPALNLLELLVILAQNCLLCSTAFNLSPHDDDWNETGFVYFLYMCTTPYLVNHDATDIIRL